ncbi:MAG: histidine kinase [Chitinophaga sp.]|uniref:sensor histidine kinase n=1 Tax=Chitinophaga sp. TaxID=1869181 RepID=UPI0025C64AE1|nr:histidine kinase [Chitinophaga sp.]MBV8254734.1 histidine kinase [Chitinophaga sp.]
MNLDLAAAWPYWVIFLFCLLMLLFFFYFREKKIRRASEKELHHKQAMLNLEIHAFQAQLDPHFIFNSLNAIHHYILTTSTDMASLYLTRFSRLMRLMMGNFNKEWVTLQEDLEALELYLQLEQLRFDKQFDYELSLDPNVEPYQTLIPPLIIQPYVQYAIWRRLLLRPEKSGGKLIINIGREDERLFIRLEDNGAPCSPLLDDTGERLANGIDIASERLYLLSERYHMEAQISAQQILDKTSLPCGNCLIISMVHTSSRQALIS